MLPSIETILVSQEEKWFEIRMRKKLITSSIICEVFFGVATISLYFYFFGELRAQIIKGKLITSHIVKRKRIQDHQVSLMKSDNNMTWSRLQARNTLFLTCLLLIFYSNETYGQETLPGDLERTPANNPLDRHPIVNIGLQALLALWRLGWKGYQNYPNSVHQIQGDPDFFKHEEATVPPIVSPGLPAKEIPLIPFFSHDQRVQSFLIERSYKPWLQSVSNDTWDINY